MPRREDDICTLTNGTATPTISRYCDCLRSRPGRHDRNDSGDRISATMTGPQAVNSSNACGCLACPMRGR